MAMITSHVLDSISGSHAAGIRCQLYRLQKDAAPELVFDLKADAEGRISEEVEVEHATRDAEFELVFHSEAYFEMCSISADTVVEKIVIRFAITDDHKRYHMPIMISPHACSAWWSS